MKFIKLTKEQINKLPEELVIRLLKERKLKPLTIFPPLKCTASSYHELEYFDPEEAWEYFCKFYVEQEGKVRAEYKIDGFRMIASQDANKKSLIYFEDAMKDVSSRLPSLVKELSTLHDSGIILDGELMEWDPNKNRWLSRHDLMKWSQAKKPGSDENVRVFVFDCLFYNGTDLHNKPLSERLKVLKEVSKKFKKHFILCPGFDIKTKEQLVKKFNYLKHHLGAYRLGGLNGIDGLMIKAYSGVYELDGKTMTWCLEENTPVLLGDGSFKRIKDLRVGDIVIDSNFMPTKVEAIRYTTDTVYAIQLPYIKEILANKDHRFLVVENFRDERRRFSLRKTWYRKHNREKETPFMNINIKWKSVDQLTENDAFLLPVPPDVSDCKQFDTDFYRLIGFYVAEGCIDTSNNTVRFTQGDRTVIEFYYNIAKKYFKVSPNIYEHQYDVNCFGKRFKKYKRYEFYISPRHKSFFIQFGLGAQNKRIPYWIYLLPKECIKQFILGLLDGGGSVNNRNYELGTSSISLAYGLALLLTKFNMTVGIHTDKNKSFYTVYWSKAKFDNPDNQRQCQPSYRIGNFVVIPIIKIVKLAKERSVVDIQTSSGTFLCPVITHNCKLKYSYEADVIVLEVHKVKNKNVYNYTVGYGIPQDKKDLFTPVKELNGKWYGVLGKTFNTKIKAKVGQILNIAATEYKKERVNGKIRYTLFQSRVITLKPDKKEPDSYLVIDRMSVEKAQSFYEALLKADDLGQITSPHGDPLPWPVSTEPLKPPKEKPKHVYRCEECGYTIESDEKLPKDLRCPICGGKLKEVKTRKDYTIYIVKKKPATGQWTIEEGMTGVYCTQVHTRGVRVELIDYITKSDMKKFGLDRDYFLDNEKIEKVKKYYDFPWKSAVKEASQEGKSSKKLTKLIDKILKDKEKFNSLPKEIKHIIALLDPVSIHQDLRLVPYVDPKKKKLAPYFEGGHWTTPGNQFKENKLLRIDEHIHLQFMLKTPHVGEYSGRIEEPVVRGTSSWLDIGAKEPFVVPPNSIGSTVNAYAFFWRHDYGEWFAGRQTSPHGRHFKLFKFKGKLLNGWIVFMYAPIRGRRIWICYKPKEKKQREYEEHYFGNKKKNIDIMLLEDAEEVYRVLYKVLNFH